MALDLKTAQEEAAQKRDRLASELLALAVDSRDERVRSELIDRAVDLMAKRRRAIGRPQ